MYVEIGLPLHEVSLLQSRRHTIHIHASNFIIKTRVYKSEPKSVIPPKNFETLTTLTAMLRDN